MHYRRRLFSTIGFGPRLGLGLLLGSAGLALATTLLLFLAGHAGTAAHAEWKATTKTHPHGFNLSLKTFAHTDFQPLVTLAPTGQLHYAFADTYLYQGHSGLLPGLVVYRPTPRGPDATYPTTTATGTMSVVQRSWGTVKLMFR
ncbi:hypothetical protein A0257_16795 [Hymenobacter psoromatis]|nr:hypothetical protein A0257_16795 [Hymenobacter psoromatis]